MLELMTFMRWARWASKGGMMTRAHASRQSFYEFRGDDAQSWEVWWMIRRESEMMEVTWPPLVWIGRLLASASSPSTHGGGAFIITLLALPLMDKKAEAFFGWWPEINVGWLQASKQGASWCLHQKYDQHHGTSTKKGERGEKIM